jgi:hypothetical protein
MRRVLITVFASLLAAALIAPAAQGATQFRQVRSEMTMPATSPGGIIYVPAGRLTLDFVFKNTRSNKKKFTPRQLTRIAFESVPLSCSNAPVNPTGNSEFLLTTSLETKIKLEKVPHPKPKPGKYAFRFAYSFPAFTGTIGGTIKKVTNAPKPRTPRAQGVFIIEDLDAGPGQWNCSTQGRRNWAGESL